MSRGRDRRWGDMEGVELVTPVGRQDEILTPEAVAFVADLHRRFDQRRFGLLEARQQRQAMIDSGATPDFLRATASIREGEWRVVPPASDLLDRRCEITGPVDRKMMINALNSGARVFMADFEDSNSPTWPNVIEGQINLLDAVRGTIEFTSPEGKEYRLGTETATLMVRPRGWHLVDRHFLVDGEPVSASLLDFGLYFFHNAAPLVASGSGPYFYLPKLESHLEARLWNDVFVFAQGRLGFPTGTIRATVLIETILAAYEMDEILYELRHHSAGLNAGRWDYLFSIIKRFRNREDMVLPDRSQLTMDVPFMRAYTDLLIATCHRRGAQAIGGMAAFIPTRSDPDANDRAFTKVREDKEREAQAGHDGTWVAHPGLVELATDVFSHVLGDRPHQIDRTRPDVVPDAGALIDVKVDGGRITDDGVRLNVDVAIQYVASWLRGVGAAAIYNLMEDAATAEISRSQLWQWVRHGVSTESGTKVDRALVSRVADEELERLEQELGAEEFHRGRFVDARRLLEQVALSPDFPEFLTLPAYETLTTKDAT